MFEPQIIQKKVSLKKINCEYFHILDLNNSFLKEKFKLVPTPQIEKKERKRALQIWMWCSREMKFWNLWILLDLNFNEFLVWKRINIVRERLKFRLKQFLQTKPDLDFIPLLNKSLSLQDCQGFTYRKNIARFFELKMLQNQ